MIMIRKGGKGFTLIELLIVIAVIAVVSVIVVMVLNPAELLRQGRDSVRASELDTLKSALNLAQSDGLSLGTPNTVYVSIADTSPTCANLGLPVLPPGWQYSCVTAMNLARADGTGWIPVNFRNFSGGSPIATLPLDPINATSSRLYYTYTTDGQHYEVTAALESAKYKLGGSNDAIVDDGGPFATVYEKGTRLGLEPLDYGDPALVGYWPLSEGTGTAAYDDSGSNNAGAWYGSEGGTNGYYSPGQPTAWAGYFNGLQQQTGLGALVTPQTSTIVNGSALTVTAWINISPSISMTYPTAIVEYYGYLFLYLTGSTPNFYINYGHLDTICNGWVTQVQGGPVTSSNWIFIAVTETFGGSSQMYINGNPTASAASYGPPCPRYQVRIGGELGGNYTTFNGLIDDVRIYNRALSAAEIQAMYNGKK